MSSVFVSTPAEVVVVDSRTRSGTITLPLTNSIPNRVLNFKDQYGTFSNSTLTLSTQLGESFDDGTTSKIFSNAFTFMNLYAVSSKWMVMGGTQTVQQTISSLTVNQLTFGTGAGWVQFGPLQASVVSSIQENTNALYANTSYFGTTSTVTALQYYGLFGNYNNTVLAEVSTGAGTQELLVFKGSSTTDRVRVQTTGTFVVETGVSARLFSNTTLPTLSNATPAFIINASSNVGIQTAAPGTALDVNGTARAIALSSQQVFTSSILAFTTSSQQVFVSSLNADQPALRNNLFSTVAGLGQLYLSTPPLLLSTGALFTSSVLASTITTSSLQVNSLTIGTGTGWLNLGPLQTVAISSIQDNTNALYANTSFFGTTSTLTALQFYGLFGNYNNTVLAEVSTGSGTQELLVFKGSSTTDRVRVQTTGNFVVETGVSARLFSTTTLPTLSNATPAFIINSSSNVGIQTATPGTALDVAGTGRFVTLSSQQLFTSSFNGDIPITRVNALSTVAGLGSLGYLSSASLASSIVSTTNAFLTAGYVSSPNLLNLVSTNNLLELVSTPNLLNLVSTSLLDASLASTIFGLPPLSIPENLSTIFLKTSTLTASSISLLDSSVYQASPNVLFNLAGIGVLKTTQGFASVDQAENVGPIFANTVTIEKATIGGTPEYFYSVAAGNGLTGKISTPTVTDGNTGNVTGLYVSSLYLGDTGGSLKGQITTDATATNLFWNDSQLNNQGGAVPYISAFTVSTGSAFASSITTELMSSVNLYAATLNMSVVFI